MPLPVENFKRWVGRYIPQQIRDENKLDALVHAHVIVGLLFGAMALCILGLLVVPFIPAVSLPSFLLALVVSATCFGCYFLSLKHFQRTASFFLAGNLFAFPSFSGILVEVWFTGGFDSPFVCLLLTIPVLVFMMAGRAVGSVWMVIVLAAIAGLYYMQALGFHSPQVLQQDVNLPLWWLANWFLVCVVTAVALWVYDLVNRNLAERLEGERNQFAFQAAHDTLTRIANRDTFEKYLRDTIDRCRRGGTEKAVVVFVDLDNFKPINDKYGHQAGDQVLRAVADRIRNAVRTTDMVARVGGDEFAVILNGFQSVDDVNVILDDLLSRVASPIRTREATLEITCSAGAVICPDHGADPESLASYADELMYRAKKTRNSFVFAS